jgi:putative NADH-flavin reductase
LSALGQTKGSPPTLQTTATQHIIAAMQRHRIRRLISLTGAGVAAPEDRPKFINHLIAFALKTFSGGVLKDAEGHAALIRASGLDWTLVRGPMLTEGPHTGAYRVGWVGINTGPRISRADVADFMLKQVTDRSFINQAPMISD